MNLQSVALYDIIGKPIVVPDFDNFPMNITSFTFSFVVSAANVDSHAPVKIKKNNYQTIS